MIGSVRTTQKKALLTGSDLLLTGPDVPPTTDRRGRAVICRPARTCHLPLTGVGVKPPRHSVSSPSVVSLSSRVGQTEPTPSSSWCCLHFLLLRVPMPWRQKSPNAKCRLTSSFLVPRLHPNRDHVPAPLTPPPVLLRIPGCIVAPPGIRPIASARHYGGSCWLVGL